VAGREAHGIRNVKALAEACAEGFDTAVGRELACGFALSGYRYDADCGTMAFDFRHESEEWRTLTVNLSRQTIQDSIRESQGYRVEDEDTRGVVALYSAIEETLCTGGQLTGSVTI
jgi:hypothetical protein